MGGKRYLLDTNILSDLVRHPGGAVSRRIRRVGEDTVCPSLIVAAELRYGALKKGSARLVAQLDTILPALDVVPVESPTEERYARVRLALEKAGPPIGGNDTLIAAHAIALGLTLVTDNRREFERVPGLVVENWLDR